MSGSQRRTAQEDSIRPALFPGYHTTCLPIKWSSVWCLMCLRRHHLRDPGNAEKASPASPPPTPHQWRNRHYTMPQKGSNYRMDGRLLYKYEAADRPGRACWCQVSNKYQQDRVTAELPRVDSVRNADTFQHQRQAKTRGETEAIDIFWSLWCCTTVLEFQTIKRELWSDWDKSWQIMQHSILKKLQSCPKLLLVTFKTRDLTAALNIFPQVCCSSVSWLSKCGRGRQRQADTLAFPYGTFCKAIGVSLHDPDCHWLVMKASRAEADPSLWGMEVGVRGRPGGLDGQRGRGSPVACHSPCTTAWPPTLSGLCTMGGLGLDCMSSHSPLPPPSSQHRGRPKGVKTLWTGISPL